MTQILHRKWNIMAILSFSLLLVILNSPYVQGLEQFIPIQSVYSNSFTADVVFDQDVATISGYGQLMNYNISILLIFEQEDTIIGVMHLYGPSNSWNLEYMIGNFENEIYSWNEGVPQTHFTFSDPSTIHFSFLELAPLIQGDLLQIRALSFYTFESQDSIQIEIHSIFSNYKSEFSESQIYGTSQGPVIHAFPIFTLIIVSIWSSKQIIQKTKKKAR